jgi:hypothetical protein
MDIGPKQRNGGTSTAGTADLTADKTLQAFNRYLRTGRRGHGAGRQPCDFARGEPCDVLFAGYYVDARLPGRCRHHRAGGYIEQHDGYIQIRFGKNLPAGSQSNLGTFANRKSRA